jgi:phytoene/squalene synthetase
VSQLSFDFNASAPVPLETEPVISAPPVPEKKFRPKRVVQRDWEKLLWLTRFLNSESRDASLVVLRWCRGAETQARLRSIEAVETRLGDVALEFPAFHEVMARYRIPIDYPLAFLQGLADENNADMYETWDDLLLHARRISGSVALMLAHVAGLSHPGALKNACDLGVAAQLTRIARNVREDFENGRVCLPLSWLRDEGVPSTDLFIPRHRPAVWRVVTRLLKEADRLYASADLGFKFLSLRSALVMAAAKKIHAESGVQIVAVGSAALDCPTVASPFRARWAAFKGALPLVRQVPFRLLSPWKPAPIHLVWEVLR